VATLDKENRSYRISSENKQITHPRREGGRNLIFRVVTLLFEIPKFSNIILRHVNKQEKT
jgi:hypothetical protein